MEESKVTSVEIEEARVFFIIVILIINKEKYRIVAKRGSVLYFAIADLSLIDSMY